MIQKYPAEKGGVFCNQVLGNGGILTVEQAIITILSNQSQVKLFIPINNWKIISTALNKVPLQILVLQSISIPDFLRLDHWNRHGYH